MKAEYKLKDGKILKDGHTMFLKDVIKDLNIKSYLESLLTLKEQEPEKISVVIPIHIPM